MDLLNINFSTLSSLIPWVAFIAGLGGSLHCVGMCGGLVTASCSQGSDIFRYQIGRLIGYMVLGIVGAVLGEMFHFGGHPFMSLLSAIVIGLMFIFWGLESLIGKRQILKETHPLRRLPGQFLSKTYGSLWKKLVFKNATFTRSFFTGLVSIFLPCGLLYGVVISQVALVQATHQYHQVFIAMIFFWAGTLPSMVFAPKIFQKILRPLKEKLPKAFAVTLMVIGLTTITYRVIHYNEMQHNKTHHSPSEGQGAKAPMCH